MTLHTFKMPEAKAEMIHKVVASQCEALKNWMASAVERGDFDRAKELVGELRDYQTIFAAFNMSAKHTIAEGTGKALETAHIVKDARD